MPWVPENTGSMFQEIIADFAPQTVTPFPVIVARLVGAVLLVAIIGVERETKDRPAGLRTHMLVGLAACLFALLAAEVPNAEMFQEGIVQSDPLRVVESVTAGVAFLAAGFIVFSKGEVRGLTTGAGIWLAASVGVAVGFGFWGMAAAATILGGVLLRLVYAIERWMDWK
jgi:putative Mg2+ transporter-C (MgtC) family protein